MVPLVVVPLVVVPLVVVPLVVVPLVVVHMGPDLFPFFSFQVTPIQMLLLFLMFNKTFVPLVSSVSFCFVYFVVSV